MHSPHLPLGPVRTLKDLCRAVRETFLGGQRRALETDVLSRWHTGRLLRESVLEGEARAPHGAEVVPQVAKAEHIDERLLYQCMQFYDAFPKVGTRPLLNWSQFRRLMQVADPAARVRLTRKAITGKWTSADVAARVTAHNAALRARGAVIDVSVTEIRAVAPLRPRRGTVGIFRLAAGVDALSVDLGFTSFLDLPPPQNSGLTSGDLMTLDDSGRASPAAGAAAADLYTYRADLLRVIDGDTIWFRVHLAPRHWLKEKLRLRGIDCPELSAAGGHAAKRFVEAQLAGATAITVCTSKADKYDRYLADVFWTTRSGEEVFLNNRLLEHGHAVRTERYPAEEWEK
jgi:endonuclease YncB( thermonuclease family)